MDTICGAFFADSPSYNFNSRYEALIDYLRDAIYACIMGIVVEHIRRSICLRPYDLWRSIVDLADLRAE